MLTQNLEEPNQLQREALLEATEKELDLIVQATQREKRALKGQDKISDFRTGASHLRDE